MIFRSSGLAYVLPMTVRTRADAFIEGMTDDSAVVVVFLGGTLGGSRRSTAFAFGRRIECS